MKIPDVAVGEEIHCGAATAAPPVQHARHVVRITMPPHRQLEVGVDLEAVSPEEVRCRRTDYALDQMHRRQRRSAEVGAQQRREPAGRAIAGVPDDVHPLRQRALDRDAEPESAAARMPDPRKAPGNFRPLDRRPDFRDPAVEHDGILSNGCSASMSQPLTVTAVGSTIMYSRWPRAISTSASDTGVAIAAPSRNHASPSPTTTRPSAWVPFYTRNRCHVSRRGDFRRQDQRWMINRSGAR
jgi:hypothetical protein